MFNFIQGKNNVPNKKSSKCFPSSISYSKMSSIINILVNHKSPPAAVVVSEINIVPNPRAGVVSFHPGGTTSNKPFTKSTQIINKLIALSFSGEKTDHQSFGCNISLLTTTQKRKTNPSLMKPCSTSSNASLSSFFLRWESLRLLFVLFFPLASWRFPIDFHSLSLFTNFSRWWAWEERDFFSLLPSLSRKTTLARLRVKRERKWESGRGSVEKQLLLSDSRARGHCCGIKQQPLPVKLGTCYPSCLPFVSLTFLFFTPPWPIC